MPVPYDSVSPFPRLNSWKKNQTLVSSQPLEFCPDFPRIAARHEAWWRCELEGPPLFVAYANNNPSKPLSRRLDLLTQPEAWFETRFEQVKQQHHVGDSFPTLRVDFGPVMLGGLLGGKVEFVSDTSWTHAMIRNDWSNMPNAIEEDNPWWNLLPKLVKITAENAPGKYIVCTPSLGGSADLLLNLRGSSALSLDVIDQPEKVAQAVALIYPLWRKTYQRIFDICSENSAGLVNWVALWSNQPYIVTECDFNYLIGPLQFQRLFLPDLARQAATVGRSIFHLDGPGATRHIDSLLDTPEIQAIQYVPGAGNSALSKLDMLRKIQKKGCPLQITAPAAELVQLSKELEPNGLAFLVFDSLSVTDLENLYSQMMKRFQ